MHQLRNARTLENVLSVELVDKRRSKKQNTLCTTTTKQISEVRTFLLLNLVDNDAIAEAA